MEPNGILQLEFKRKKTGETYVSRQFFKLPLQILPVNYLEQDKTAFLYLLNPSSGMLEGDLFREEFRIQENAWVVITTPSSNKIYRSQGKTTRLELTVTVAAGGRLEYLPEYNVPFKDAKYLQKGTFYVEKAGSVFLWDTVMPGRLARGETFDFTSYGSRLSLYYDKELVLCEGMRLEPDRTDPHNEAVLGQYNLFASAYLVAEDIPQGLCDKLRRYLREANVCGNCSVPGEHILVIKLLFEKNLGVQEVMCQVWNIVREETYGKSGFRIRKY